jgi:hypothetical protein
MKKLTISTALILFTLVLNGQELKKVILRKCGKNVSEVYQVRRDNETIKEGLYQRFFCFVTEGIQDYVLSPDDQKRLVKEMGYFKNGKKDSLWTTYSYSTRMNEQGMYKEDIKVGVWKKMKKVEYGYVYEHYDYSKNVVLEPEIEIIISYPNYAIEKEIEGVVGLTFNLKKDCTIENLKVVNSVGGGCDEEAMRKIKRQYELKKAYNCKCEEKSTIEKVVFNLE